MQKSEQERGQWYRKEEVWARLHNATPMLIIQGTKEGRTKEQGLFRLVPTLTGAFWSYNDPDTPGQLHQETVKADMTVLLPGARQKKAPCFKLIRKKEIS